MKAMRNQLCIKSVGTGIVALFLILFLTLTGCAANTSKNVSSNASSTSSSEDATTVRVASLKGATSIGLASMMQNQNDDTYDFQIYATADEVAPLLASGDADIALIPANLAATLYERTQGGIQVIDVNTLGVLYAITADDTLKSQEDLNYSDLAGRTIYMTGKGTVPEYTVLCLLNAAGLTNADVQIEFKSEPAEVVALLATDPTAIGIVPQPFATAAVLQNDALANVMDLTEQWDLLTAGDAIANTDSTNTSAPLANTPLSGKFVTGVTVARSQFIAEHPEAITTFLEAHAASAAVAENDPSAIAQEVVDLGIVGATPIAEKAIPLCNVVCLVGEDMKSALSGYLDALFVLAPEALGNAIPDDSFYYIG